MGTLACSTQIEATMSHDFGDDQKAQRIPCAACWSLEPITFERFGAVTMLCKECGRRWDLRRSSETTAAAAPQRPNAHLRLVTPSRRNDPHPQPPEIRSR
jgi:hypothetical protein